MNYIQCPKCKKNILHFTTAEKKDGSLQVVKIQCFSSGLIGEIEKTGIFLLSDRFTCVFPIDSSLFSLLVEKYLRMNENENKKEKAKIKADKALGAELLKIKTEYEEKMDELEVFIRDEIERENIK